MVVAKGARTGGASETFWHAYADQVEHFTIEIYEMPKRWLSATELAELTPISIRMEATVVRYRSNRQYGYKGQVNEVEVHHLHPNFCEAVVEPGLWRSRSAVSKAIKLAVGQHLLIDERRVRIPLEVFEW